MLQAYLDGLQQISVWLFNVLGLIWQLYQSNPILLSVFTLWVLDRVFHIYDFIKG